MSGLPDPSDFGYMYGLNRALHDEMESDDSVFVLGEDIGVGASGVTTGLLDRFGRKRVVDTPLSEQGFTSFATGAAILGLRPVIEFQISSLLYLVFEQIVNQAHKFSLMTGGQIGVPVTYLVSGSGSRLGWAGQHSDSPYSLFAHCGVKTVVPGAPNEAYSLMRSAIRDPDPVAVFAPSALLEDTREPLSSMSRQTKLGMARVVRAGSDLTIVALGQHVRVACKVAETHSWMSDIEVIDLSSVYPVDWATIGESIRKTGRLIVIDDSNKMCGLGAEIIATCAENWPMRSAPVRVCRPDGTIIPYSLCLDRSLVPDEDDLARAVGQVVGSSSPVGDLA